MLFFKKSIRYLIYIFCAPIVFFIHFLKPFRCIKLCEIYSYRFGPIITPTEGFLYEKYNTQAYKNCIVLFYFPLNRYISNQQAKIMIERSIYVSPFRTTLKFLKEAIIFWGKEKNHILDLQDFTKRQAIKSEILWEKKNDAAMRWFKHPATYLSFNSEEKKRGLQLLEKLGIEPGYEWICINSRDAGYLNKSLPNQGSKVLGSGDWSYQNYRDSSINSMVAAAEFFASKGYYVLRMGKFVNEELITKNPKIIDYANSKLQSDFSDMYLLANCKTIIGGDSGITEIPYIYKKQIHFSNMIFPFTTFTWYNPWIFLFKRIKDLKTGKLLSVKEILNSDFAYPFSTHIYNKYGVTLIENTSEDIKSLAVEIFKGFEGQPIEDKEDLRIQKEFWEIYYHFIDKNKIRNVQPKISPSFLRNNLDLLN